MRPELLQLWKILNTKNMETIQKLLEEQENEDSDDEDQSITNNVGEIKHTLQKEQPPNTIGQVKELIKSIVKIISKTHEKRRRKKMR